MGSDDLELDDEGALVRAVRIAKAVEARPDVIRKDGRAQRGTRPQEEPSVLGALFKEVDIISATLVQTKTGLQSRLEAPIASSYLCVD